MPASIDRAASNSFASASSLRSITSLATSVTSASPARTLATAIEAVDGPGAPLRYSWRDLERGSAKIANLLASLNLPAGARIAAQVEKSPEALMLYLATIRAGFIYLPLNTAYRSDEMAYFIENASPAVVVCTHH